MPITAITIPKWGIEMQEATLAEWKLEPGAAVAKGDEIVDLETDKIVNTHEAPASGVLRRQIGEAGQNYDVGALIGVIADAETDDTTLDRFIKDFVPVDASFDGESDAAPVAAANKPVPAAVPSGEGRISPIAQRLAESLGIDWTSITGTGRNGRISKQDVETAAQSTDRQPLARTALQRTTAQRMQMAKREVPHFYLNIDIGCDEALRLKDAFNVKHECKITLNDVLVRAVAIVLRNAPALNVTYSDGEVYAADDRIGVAIASSHGLVAPTIASAAASSLVQISQKIRSLAQAAENRSLVSDDLASGATTISNLGMFGVDAFSAIINPPQTSIIAVGRAEQKAVVTAGALEIATVMRVTMACDHRALDGADGARFLAALKALLENPAELYSVEEL